MNDNVIIPTRASKESAGLDLYSSIDVDIEVGSIKKVNTGICISLPENSYGSIRDKSCNVYVNLVNLSQCKYKLKKRKIVNYIDDDDDDDDDAVDSHLNFSVPDSYVEI